MVKAFVSDFFHDTHRDNSELIPDTDDMLPKLESIGKSRLGIRSSMYIAKHSRQLMIPTYFSL
jgi:hypothetical protein